jgi:AcrR family transcriptional regulator
MGQALSRRERKKQETRQALLQAAWVLFHDKGFDDTTIEEITERADVAKGTFFNYFASKDALLGEWTVWRFSQLREALDVSRGAPASPMARIQLLLRHLHGQMLDDWRLFQQAFATRLGKPPPAHHHAGHHPRHRLTGLLTDLVKEAQECGEIRADVDAEVVGDLMFMTHIRHLAVCIRKEGAPPADDSDQVLDVLMSGLAGPNWTRPGGAAPSSIDHRK